MPLCWVGERSVWEELCVWCENGSCFAAGNYAGNGEPKRKKMEDGGFGGGRLL